jgi:hypothetical protein
MNAAKRGAARSGLARAVKRIFFDLRQQREGIYPQQS